MEHIESYTTKKREDPRINRILTVMRKSAPVSMGDEALQARAKQVLVLYGKLFRRSGAEKREAA